MADSAPTLVERIARAMQDHYDRDAATLYERLGEKAAAELAEVAVRVVVSAMQDTSRGTIEEVAKAIARADGARMTFQHPRTREMQTVASQAGYGRWGHSAEKYAEDHWQKYKSQAEAAIEAMPTWGWQPIESAPRADRGYVFCDHEDWHLPIWCYWGTGGVWGEGWYVEGELDHAEPQPTHWLPLPQRTRNTKEQD